MQDVDRWLADAARVTKGSADEFDLSGLRRRMGDGAASGAVLVWGDVRSAMLCAGLAALLAFAGMDTLAGRAFSRPAITWIATPPAVSPFGLLVGQ